jgi:hypothetical protein
MQEDLWSGLGKSYGNFGGAEDWSSKNDGRSGGKEIETEGKNHKNWAFCLVLTASGGFPPGQ